MESKDKDKYIKELEGRVEELEDRMSAIEDIFAPAILDRQTAHVEAKQGDARDTLSQGDVKRSKFSIRQVREAIRIAESER
jgi:hypothetical protein